VERVPLVRRGADLRGYMTIMPLSFGIPLGLLLVVVGAILFFVTKHKKAAAALFGVGVAVAGGTIVLIGLVLAYMP